MIHIDKIKESISYLFCEAWKYKPFFFVLYITDMILCSIQPFIGIFCIRAIVDNLVSDKNERLIILYTVIMICGNFIVNMLRVVIPENIHKRYCDILNNYLEAKLAYKNMSIEFEKTENKTNLDEAQKAKVGIGLGYSGGIQGVSDSFAIVVSNIVIFVTTTGIIFVKAPLLVLPLLVNVLINRYVNQRKNDLQIKQYSRLSYISRAFNYLYFTLADVRYAHDIRLYNADELMRNTAQEYNAEQNNILKGQQKKIFSFLKISSVNMALTAGISLLYLGILAINGNLSIGELTMATTASLTALSSLNAIITEVLELQKKCTYAYDYVSYMKKENRAINGSRKVEDNNGKYEIEFKNVYFAYPNSENYVLKDVSLKISSGEHLSVVGMNGAGKTTFIKLMCRFYPVTKGEILLNNVNINEYDYDEYVKLISAVFQDFRLLALSIKENVAIEKSDMIEEKELMDLFQKVGFADKVCQLSKGMDTPVSKHYDVTGFIPSGGEQQKLAIARALFKDSAIVILDEPTAALDPIAEYDIYKQFNDFIKNKTAIYISHRLSSCRFCDRIAVFSEGTIKECGTHEELIRIKNGVYAELYNAQAQYYAEK